MKIQVYGVLEEYHVRFKRHGDDLFLDSPPEELLVSLCSLSRLPIDTARVPSHHCWHDMLIAISDSPEVDHAYGENECPIEVTYDAQELEQIKMLFDQ